jgi:hypothetical protein
MPSWSPLEEGRRKNNPLLVRKVNQLLHSAWARRLKQVPWIEVVNVMQVSMELTSWVWAGCGIWLLC